MVPCSREMRGIINGHKFGTDLHGWWFLWELPGPTNRFTRAVEAGNEVIWLLREKPDVTKPNPFKHTGYVYVNGTLYPRVVADLECGRLLTSKHS